MVTQKFGCVSIQPFMFHTPLFQWIHSEKHDSQLLVRVKLEIDVSFPEPQGRFQQSEEFQNSSNYSSSEIQIQCGQSAKSGLSQLCKVFKISVTISSLLDETLSLTRNSFITFSNSSSILSCVKKKFVSDDKYSFMKFSK
mmetsp:Transcript_6619/g.24737  ORF Transcript_6619/g.24737 Transcript_6619/m.24737 type:complete len:140 (+) Transcript_6619:1914-2333(+)